MIVIVFLVFSRVGLDYLYRKQRFDCISGCVHTGTANTLSTPLQATEATGTANTLSTPLQARLGEASATFLRPSSNAAAPHARIGEILITPLQSLLGSSPPNQINR